jgi:hypothetical protein
MAARRLPRMFFQVLRRILVELLFALGAAEMVCLPLVLGLSSGGSRLYFHAANRIFHNGGAGHKNLLGSSMWVGCASTIDWRFSAACSTCPENLVSLANGPN